MALSRKVPPLRQWEDLAGDFAESPILLGNGFSSKLWSGFAYESLFEKFMSSVSATDQQAFRALGSSNFEFILQIVSDAIKVNEAFGLDRGRLEDAQKTVRHGLIQVIHQTHPRFDQLDMNQLNRVCDQLNAFGDIYTLSYDVLLYHIIMLAKDRHAKDPTYRIYNDFCWNKVSDEYTEFMGYNEYGGQQRHVHYLHGALFLFHAGPRDLKLLRGDTELIDRIGQEISGGGIPIFVSEGSAAEKQYAISRNDYLRFASDKLETTRPTLTVYGTSLSAPDGHITELIRRSTKRVAFAVHTSGKNQRQIERRQAEIMQKLSGRDVDFFDSAELFS